MKTFSFKGEMVEVDVSLEIDRCTINLKESDPNHGYQNTQSITLSHLDLRLLAQFLGTVCGIKNSDLTGP